MQLARAAPRRRPATRRTSSRHQLAASRSRRPRSRRRRRAAITGSVSSSSPESTVKSRGRPRMMSVICARFPDASFTPTIVGMLGELERGARLDVAAGATRHVVDDDRQVDGVGDRAEVRDDAALRRLVVHRRRRAAGASRRPRASSRESAIAFRVSFEPAPATTGTRPRACSTAISTTRRCSSSVIVAASPVEPHGHEEVDPLVDLPVDEAAQRALVDGAAGGERRASAVPQPEAAVVARHRCAVVGATSRSSRARPACVKHAAPPRRATARPASAPSANTRRSRASCTRRTCSNGASKISSCVPGTDPTRTLVIGIVAAARRGGAPLRARPPCPTARPSSPRGASRRGARRSPAACRASAARASATTARRRDAEGEVRRREHARRRPRPRRPRARAQLGVPPRGADDDRTCRARRQARTLAGAAAAVVNSIATSAPASDSRSMPAAVVGCVDARDDRSSRARARAAARARPILPMPMSASAASVALIAPHSRSAPTKNAACRRRIAGFTCSPSTTTVRLMPLALSESMCTRRSPSAPSARAIAVAAVAQPGADDGDDAAIALDGHVAERARGPRRAPRAATRRRS